MIEKEFDEARIAENINEIKKIIKDSNENVVKV